MVGWHHRVNGHEFEQTPGDSEGQGILACCSPWGHRELNTTERLNSNNPYLLFANHFSKRFRFTDSLIFTTSL